MPGRLIGRKARFLDACLAESRMGGATGRQNFWRSDYLMGRLSDCLPIQLTGHLDEFQVDWEDG